MRLKGFKKPGYIYLIEGPIHLPHPQKHLEHSGSGTVHKPMNCI